MVEICGVSKYYGSQCVLDNVSLTILPNTITSFIGPNGAGKSTLLSIMSRLVKADTGTVKLDGKDVNAYSTNEIAKRIATLRQTNHINLRLTVEELVSFGRFPYSQGRLTKEDREHIERAIDYMELGPMRHKYIGHLSGGQKQAAFIAMVVAQDTDYILLDEPLNNLDMKHSVQIMQLLRRLVDELGKTIVVVVHDINFASSYSDYIVALRNGRLIHSGPTEDIIHSHILREIFDMHIHIEEIQKTRVCVYYHHGICNPFPHTTAAAASVENRQEVTVK